MIAVEHVGGLAFVGTGTNGQTIRMDATWGEESQPTGVSPLQAFLMAMATCCGVDVVSILEKKRQDVTGYRIEIEGDRIPEGTWPRPYTAIRFRHIVSGRNLDPEAVARALELSEQKYCSVLATLRAQPEISSTFVIEDAAGL